MNRELLPREKALKFGIGCLSDKELLALILKSGYASKSVFELAQDILNDAGGLANLCGFDFEELTSIKGVGQAKALELMAIIEISKRLSNVNQVSDIDFVSPEKLVDWIRFNIGFSNQEEVFVLYLNARGSIIKSEVLFKGTERSSNVSINEILRRAILLKCNGIILSHNHPGDNAFPSNSDDKLTIRINEACKMMDIRFIDHLIVCKSNYYSYRKMNLL